MGESFPSRSLALTLLEQNFEIKNIVSVRHPVDCYLSMKLKNWTHFSPPNFEEYCTRYLAFVRQFAVEKVVKYEDFVEDSNECLKRISSLLDLPFSDDFNETFSMTMKIRLIINKIVHSVAASINVSSDKVSATSSSLVPSSTRSVGTSFFEDQL